MTQEQIQQQAEIYSGGQIDDDQPKVQFTWEHIRDGYIAGANSVLESEEYLQMKEKAGKWDNYEEEIESLHKKLAANCKKVDKWDALYKEVEKFYCNKDGEYDEENPEEQGDLCSIGEVAAAALGWL